MINSQCQIFDIDIIDAITIEPASIIANVCENPDKVALLIHVGIK